MPAWRIASQIGGDVIFWCFIALPRICFIYKYFLLIITAGLFLGVSLQSHLQEPLSRYIIFVVILLFFCIILIIKLGLMVFWLNGFDVPYCL